MATATKTSVYQIVTDRVLEQLRNGVAPWRKPWSGADAIPRSMATGKIYRGCNVFLLHCLNYDQPWFATYRQISELGGQVKKGERGCPVVFWTEWNTTDKKTGEDAKIPVLRYYTVFNVTQCEGLEGKYVASKPAELFEHDPIAAAENIVAASGCKPTIANGFNRACYSPIADRVEMPAVERFERREDYYSTLFHELTHATGHASRLNRDGITQASMFGTNEYAREELIAEMGAAFLCGEAGIVDQTIENTAAYLDGWRAKISRDPKLIVQAASAAQKAADLILNRTWSN